MTKTILLLLLATSASAQPIVYLRSGPPASVQINGATNATPVVISTGGLGGPTVNHGFATTCGTSTICYCQVGGVVAGTGPSAANGIRRCHYVDAIHLAVYDKDTDTPIGGNGVWASGANLASGETQPGSQWVAQLTPYTLGAQPLGYLDGPTGDVMRRLSLGPLNGLTSIQTTGCPSACVITIATSYDPTAAKFPVTAGNRFSVTGTGTTLDTCGDGTQAAGAQTPYTVATSSSGGWTSNAFACTGLSSGTVDYTNINLHCGPAGTPNDTIGGTQSCTRVSQLATTDNPWWTGLTAYMSTNGYASSPNYKSIFDGGVFYPHYGYNGTFGMSAVRFLVDPTSTLWLEEGAYVLDHPERENGVNWFVNEAGGFSGLATSQYMGFGMLGLPLAWGVFSPYHPTASNTVFKNKIYNNSNDPSITACTKTNTSPDGHNDVLGSGTAQAGDSTHLTLASGDARATGYYVDTVVALGVVAPFSTYSYGRVTAYDSTTKIATVASWSAGAPTTGTHYTIYSTATVSSVTAGATVTLTGVHTTFTASTHVGDAVQLSNGWTAGGADFPMAGSYVSAIASDTSITVINPGNITGSATIPLQVWYLPKWATGDCGRNWAAQHAIAFPGSQPIFNPPDGGSQVVSAVGIGNIGSNTAWIQAMANVAMDFVMAADEPRAITDLATDQSWLHDYMLQHYMNYSTGFEHDGNSYSIDAVQAGINLYTWILTQSVPSYPSMDLTGPWIAGTTAKNMFGTLPDSTDTNPWILGWGSNASIRTFSGHDDTLLFPLTFDPFFFNAPQSNLAKYWRYYLENLNFSRWGYQGLTGPSAALTFLHNDPRVGSSDYKVQPHQYAFNVASPATCAAISGWPCPANLRGDAMISRTGWASQSDTLLYFEARTFFGGYDGPSSRTCIYKVGYLLCNDLSVAGETFTGDNLSILGDTPRIGSPTVFVSGLIGGSTYGGVPGMTPITRWASANHGSWSAQYGDQNSDYIYVCSDIAGNYDQATMGITIGHMQRCLFQAKKATKDEFILQLDDYTSTSTPMAFSLHYLNNGQTQLAPTRTSAPGSTSCPGTGGCASLNTNRLIRSVQDGTTVGSAPAQTFGLTTHIDSPGTITVVDDCVGLAGGDCSPTAHYTGGNGYSHRVSIHGSAPGTPVTSFTSLVEHKIMQNLTDTTLTTTALNPDANWTGAQVCGAVSCAVFVGARGGATQAAMTGFTTTHAGTAQYLFGGLTAGNYTVTVGGTPVSGSPFTVAAGDNSLYFESPSGVISLNGSAPPSGTSSKMSGTVGASGTVIVHPPQ